MSLGNSIDRFGSLLGPLIFAAFCVLAAWIWLPEGASAPNDAGGPATSIKAQIAADEEQLAELMAVTRERPLFHASRKPVQAPEAAPIAQSPDPTLALVGIIVDHDSTIALVRISNSLELYRVEAGQQLADWQIISINGNFVEVRKGAGDPFVLWIAE